MCNHDWWYLELFIILHIILCIQITGTTENPARRNSTLFTTSEETISSVTFTTTSSIQNSHILRLGNSTIDSRKSFKVPQESLPVDEIIANHNTGTVAPMVMKVNDDFNKQYERKFGPRFEDESTNSTRMTVQVGENADLNCRISLLMDKTVSWVRRRTGRPPELLTVGTAKYTPEDRVSLAKRYPGNWKLQLLRVTADDEGFYECQISTHPPKTSSIYLHINTPQIRIIDELGTPLKEVYYENDSTLVLICRARYVDKPVALTWLHGGRALNDDVTRGGVNVRTEQASNGADSMLRLAHVNTSDAGNYSCAVKGASISTVTVHVLNEESLAELHAAGTRTMINNQIITSLVYTQLLLNTLRSKYCFHITLSLIMFIHLYTNIEFYLFTILTRVLYEG